MKAYFKLIDLPSFNDSRGSLTVLEGVLPFPINRIFWIYGADNQVRGGHRHKKTRQALIAVAGVVSVYINNGSAEKNIVLDTPQRCLLLEPEDWHTMTFGLHSVLMVISSHEYDVKDYVDEPYVLQSR